MSNDAGFTGAQWQLYSSALNWVLTDPGERIVTVLVYVRLRDPAGNPLCSGLTLSDDIIYDPLPPALVVNLTNPEPAETELRRSLASISLTIVASDQAGGSGVTEMQIANTSSFRGARWQIHTTNTLVEVDRTHTLFIRVRDAAGNTSDTVSVQVTGQSVLLLPYIQR